MYVAPRASQTEALLLFQDICHRIFSYRRYVLHLRTGLVENVSKGTALMNMRWGVCNMPWNRSAVLIQRFSSILIHWKGHFEFISNIHKLHLNLPFWLHMVLSRAPWMRKLKEWWMEMLGAKVPHPPAVCASLFQAAVHPKGSAGSGSHLRHMIIM